MSNTAVSSNVRTPDQILVDIADYVLTYKVADERSYDTARLCVTDSLACAFDALDIPGCVNLLGPLVPGTVVPNGARVPGTRFELDPATAAFNFGAMIRWSDFNDAFTAACGGHPSDNLGGILMLADYLSRSRVAGGGKPLVMRDVLEALAKAYEIQGCIAIENDFFHKGSDHNILIRVATTACSHACWAARANRLSTRCPMRGSTPVSSLIVTRRTRGHARTGHAAMRVPRRCD